MWAAVTLLGILSLPPEASSRPQMLSLEQFSGTLSRHPTRTEVLWVEAYEGRKYFVSFGNDKNFLIEADARGFFVRKISNLVGALQKEVHAARMPRIHYEEMEDEQKTILLELFQRTAADTNARLDTLDGPSKTSDEASHVIVGSKNPRIFLYQAYANGMMLGLIALWIFKPWPLRFPAFPLLAISTSGLAIGAFFVLAVKFPHLLTYERWNLWRRHSPMVVGFGLTVLPTICHQVLKLL